MLFKLYLFGAVVVLVLGAIICIFNRIWLGGSTLGLFKNLGICIGIAAIWPIVLYAWID